MHPVRKWAALFLCAAMAAAVAGCTEQTASSPAPLVVSSQPSSSSAPIVSPGDAITPGPGLVSAVSSQAQSAFEAKWAQNPLDAAYDKESGDAESTKEITELDNKYAVQWESAVVDAYQKLMQASNNDASLKSEQEKWESGKAAALQQIQESQQDNGTAGSMAVANATMAFYRDRAKQLYQELYQYDPDFTFDATN